MSYTLCGEVLPGDVPPQVASSSNRVEEKGKGIETHHMYRLVLLDGFINLSK